MTSLETLVTGHMEMFAQRATMEESFAARRQARSAGQLMYHHRYDHGTLHLCRVDLFHEMTDNSLRGSLCLEIYWAISTPATLMLLAWVLFAMRPRLQQVLAQLWRSWRVS